MHRSGPEVHGGTEEEIVVPLPDGEMTIHQFHGFTYRQSLTEVSDPRLEGTLYPAWNEDEYTLPGTTRPGIVVFTDRIENDEGAWQGSGVLLAFPEARSTSAPMVMVGEGAYEGLTAIVGLSSRAGDDCAVEGYIIEGSIPAPPVPQTGQ